jgi:4'-phosphopantetheinyl transferase
MEKPDENWKLPPLSVKLLSGEVHLWRIDLDSANLAQTLTKNPLSDDEIARAARFHFERDRKCFTETRIALRRILTLYIPIDPHEIKFTYEKSGKPEISEPQNRACVRFNVSHSGRFGIIGVSLRRGIGVDVEKYRTMEFLEIAQRYFSEREYCELKAAPADELQRYFFACWTRKEAVLKALGEGIGNSLSQISVAIDSPKLIDFQGRPSDVQQWSILDVNVHSGYVGAVAFEGGTPRVQRWDFASSLYGLNASPGTGSPYGTKV